MRAVETQQILTVLGTKLCFFPAAVVILGVLGVRRASVNGMLDASLVVSDWSVVLSIHAGGTAITTQQSNPTIYRNVIQDNSASRHKGLQNTLLFKSFSEW